MKFYTEARQDPELLKKVVFIQHDLPGLAAGKYSLSLSQQIKDKKGKVISEREMSNQYRFAVTGDRFRIVDPERTVYSVFPGDGASGNYTNVLPHAVFHKSTFPWIRTPQKAGSIAAPDTGTDAEKDLPTWLTVLLLDEDDAAAAQKAGLNLQTEPVTASIGDLFPPKLVPKSTLGEHYSYFHQAASVTEALEPGQEVTDPIHVLDIPLQLFWQIAPTVEDLKLMAHVRQVSLENKATMAGISDVGEALGKFSIVFGNRLPQFNRRCNAFLVSLEGLEAYLPTDGEGGAPQGTSLNPKANLRLAILRSWTFFSMDQAAKFTDQVLKLNAPDGDALLRLPYHGNHPQVGSAIRMGYAPMNHIVRTGEKTVSWYRGPLAPFPIEQMRIKLPLASPDHGTLYDPTQGMLDISYSAAWTLGRQMALQDTTFSTSLYNWKRQNAQQVLASQQRTHLVAEFAAVMKPAHLLKARHAGEELTKTAQPSLLQGTLLHLLDQMNNG